jgi:hypothetical protein
MRRLVGRVNSWVANMIPSAFYPAQANVFLLPLWPPTHLVLFGSIRGQTRPAVFFASTAATKCSLTNLLGAQTFTHCCCLAETFDFFIGRENILSVVRKYSLTLDRISARSELLNGLGNRLPIP